MDTRFWGPSGWRLLHSITFAYIPHTEKNSVRQMFEMLPFVLPCKFCRASLTEYMKVDPLEPALESRDALTKWLWRIHNQVNAKLRIQKLNVEKDPPFEKVAEFYNELLAAGCSQTEFPGWDFLFSIAELHPMSKSALASVPMPRPDGIRCEEIESLEEKNRWNCLKAEERLPLYRKFWAAIGKVLPFPSWRKSWAKHATNLSLLNRRSGTMKWLWRIRCAMETDLELLNSCKYSHLCKTLKSHRSGCAKSVRAKTCRKIRTNK